MAAEVWRAIPGVPGHEASSLGRIRRSAAVLRPITSGRYPYLTIRVGGRRQTCMVHRLVAAAFLPPPEGGRSEINHINGRRADARPENLEWVTPSENVRHAISHGLRAGQPPQPAASQRARGERSGGAKLSAANVLEMRRLRAAGVRLSEIASRFGVTATNARRVVLGLAWAHVHEESIPDRRS